MLTTERDLPLPETLWVGWVVKRVALDGLATEPAKVTLSDVSVISAPWGSLDPPAWEARSETGVEPRADGGVDMALDGSTIGQAVAASGRTLTGDFEVIARIDPEPWTRAAGETRSFALQVVSLDEFSQAYVAFNETESRRGFTADAMVGGSWQNFTELEVSEPAATWYRLARSDGHVTASSWADCRWRSVASFEAPLTAPVSVRVVAANEWEATVPAALAATVHLERVADGPHLRDLEPWAPPTCSVTSPVAVPADLVLPEGTIAATSRAPFPLGRVFFGPDGTGYAFSSSPERAALLALAPDGTSSILSESDLFAGLNRKSGAWWGDRLLVAVDYWPEGGNATRGIVELAPDGSVVPWPGVSDTTLGAGAAGVAGLAGIVDLAALPDGGLLVVDFEADQVFRLPARSAVAAVLITHGPVPAGMLAAVLDPVSGSIETLDADGAGHLGGPAGIARITPDGQSLLEVAPPEGSTGLAGIARSDGRVLPTGLYATDPSGGRVLRLTAENTLVTVVAGVPGATELAFDPASGDLLVTYDGDKLLRVSRAP